MANKLLAEIKELGYEHDKVLEILKAHQEAEGTEEEEEEEQEEQEEEQEAEGTPNDEDKEKKIDINISKLTKDITESVSKSVSKTVTAEIKKQIKLLRGKPPKGEIGDISLGNDPFIKKNLYERIV